MRIAILGFGKEGQAAAEYWKRGNDITICDQDENLVIPDEYARHLGPDYLRGLEEFHLIVRSPQVHPREIVAANNEHVLTKVTTGTEEFIRNCPAPIIAVTGTKGKGTTASLITKIIENVGYRVHLGGNIGIPPIEMLRWGIQPEDWVVLEVSNFQLIDLRVSPKIAVCVMVVPEHLDWHGDLAEYLHSKQNLFRHQSDEDLAVFNRVSDYSTEVAGVSPALKMSYEVPPLGRQPTEENGAYVLGNDIYMDDERVCSVDDVALLGRHNLENVCAAITATWDLIGGRVDCIIKAVHEFSGMAHRLEFVREANNVRFFNDSFAATPQAAMAAIEAIPGPKVLIAGGVDRGLDLSPLADEIVRHENNVAHTILIGQTAPKLANLLNQKGYQQFEMLSGRSMHDIVAAAVHVAMPGQSVVLSPGCASFDMFKNFEDRGLQFKAEVDSL